MGYYTLKNSDVRTKARRRFAVQEDTTRGHNGAAQPFSQSPLRRDMIEAAHNALADDQKVPDDAAEPQ